MWRIFKYRIMKFTSNNVVCLYGFYLANLHMNMVNIYLIKYKNYQQNSYIEY